MNTKKCIILIFAALIFFAGGFALGSVDTEEQIVKIPEAVSGEVLAEMQTRVLLLREYEKSELIRAEDIRLPEELIGSDEKAISSHYADWEMRSFSAETIVLRKTLSSYAPGTFLLSLAAGEDGENLAVYSFDIDGQKYLFRELSLPAALYDDATAAVLREGVYAGSPEELAELLARYEY